MRYNSKLRERFDLSLDGKQVSALVVGSLVVIAGTFILGMSLGRQLAPRAAPATAAPQPPLARLDDPLPVVANDEPPPALQAHDALVGKADDALPVPPVNPPSVQEPAPAMPLAAREAREPGVVAPAPALPAAAAAMPAAPPTHTFPSRGEGTREGTPERAEAALRAPAIPAGERPAPVAAAGERAGSERGRDRSHAVRPKTVADTHSAPHGSNAYTIQIGASSRRVDAERLAKRFESKRSRVIAADVPGKGRWYRVQLGSYPTRDAASRQLASLARAGVHGIVTAER